MARILEGGGYRLLEGGGKRLFEGETSGVWSVVSINSATSANGNLTVPADLITAAANGDLIVAAFSWASTTDFTPPGGWSTAVSLNNGDMEATTAAVRSGGIYWTVKSGGTVADTFARTGGQIAVASFVVYRWSGTGTITLDTTSSNTIATGSKVGTTGALAVTNPSSLIIVADSASSTDVSSVTATSPSTYISRHNSTLSAPDIWQHRRLAYSYTSPFAYVSLIDAQKTASGSTGTISVTHSSSTRRHNLFAAAFYVNAGGEGPPSTGGGQFAYYFIL